MNTTIKKYLDLLFKSRYDTPQCQLELVNDINRRGFLRQIVEVVAFGVMAKTCCSLPTDYSKFLPDLGDSDRLNLSIAEANFIGKQIIYNIANQGDVLNDYDLSYYLNYIGNNLVSYSALSGIQAFNFYPLKGKEINAFALPGGYICVYNGLIYTTQSEAELIGVMSHEIGHIVQHHIFRNISVYDRNQWLSLAGIITGALLAPINLGAAVAAASGGHGLAIQNILSFSREFEREADRVGQNIMYGAGYDAHAMPDFFSRLQNSEKFNSNEALAFLQTHPVTIERLSEAELRANQLPVKMRMNSVSYNLMREKCRVRQLGSNGAINYYKQCLKSKRYADINIIYYGYAFASVGVGAFSDAIIMLTKITSVSIMRHPAYYGLKAIAYSGLGKYNDSYSVYEEALDYYPEYKGLWLGRLDLMMSTKKYKKAGVYINGLVNKHPNDNDLWLKMAYIYSDSNLNNKQLYFYALGNQQYILGNYKGALLNYQLALKNSLKSDGELSDVISSKIIDMQNIIKANTKYGGN